jgi:putative flippase GtrA
LAYGRSRNALGTGTAIRPGARVIVRLTGARRFRLTSGLSVQHAIAVRAAVLLGNMTMDDRDTGAPPLERMLHRYGKKARRFLVVSAFNVAFGQSLLVLAYSWLGWAFAVSNAAAVALSAGPAYVLTRYWVWEKWSKNHLVREVLPFWGLAFFGLILSTVAAGIADSYTDAQLVLNLVNLAAFGLLWVFKFFIFDRLMFGRRHRALGSAP